MRISPIATLLALVLVTESFAAPSHKAAVQAVGKFAAAGARSKSSSKDNAGPKSLSNHPSVIVLDGFGYPDPSNPKQMVGSFLAYTCEHLAKEKQISQTTQKLQAYHLDLGKGKIDTIINRVRMFVAKPVSATLSATAGGVKTNIGGGKGITETKVKLGSANGPVEVKVPGQKVSATIYPSGASGFAVISDIDDTVKVSHVLDPLAVARATLIDSPQAVSGMPALYGALAKSLNGPQFVYVSGSPFQLYPFLHDFIASSYAASKGPIMLQNIAPGDFSWLKSDATKILNYKTEMIAKVKGMYPQKKFLLIGDSGQKDPETYGNAFRKYGDKVVACIWIRAIPDKGADNSASRFDAAFKGVPKTKFRVFKDGDIAGMQKINVARGKC